MMPVMDGLDMVKAIKADHNTCHIPIILLSAKSSLDDRIAGLEQGIDDYITKPFSSTYLKTRILSLLRQRKQLQDLYLSKLSEHTQEEDHINGWEPSQPQVTPYDEQFMQQVMAFMEEQMDNTCLLYTSTHEAWHDGIYYTGDVAWKDEDGYLWFVGRADDVIKSSGYRIGPFEVESALMTHPAVVECAITGVPDEIRGQVVKATIVLSKDYKARAGEELIKELQNHVKKVTAPYKYPRVIEFVEELPKTCLLYTSPPMAESENIQSDFRCGRNEDEYGTGLRSCHFQRADRRRSFLERM